MFSFFFQRHRRRRRRRRQVSFYYSKTNPFSFSPFFFYKHKRVVELLSLGRIVESNCCMHEQLNSPAQIDTELIQKHRNSLKYT